jgi:cysteate synthase
MGHPRLSATRRAHQPRVTLTCCSCGRTYDRQRLHCDVCRDALLRSTYRITTFEPTEAPGIFKYAAWLPGEGSLPTRLGPAVFPSGAYGESLGLTRLFIAFNGYAPDRGAHNITGTFKDLEAGPTLVYFREQGHRSLVLASAGNTARAFAYACSESDFPCCVVVPEAMLHRVWLPRRPSESVMAVVLEDSDSYPAAIALADQISVRLNVTSEGGVRNVARRDGLGTTILEYARLMRSLPAHYVQAVGSGAGGIAAYEASRRLIEDGRFGGRLPALHLAQNLSFAPIHEAWSNRWPATRPAEPLGARRTSQIYADVLSHGNPPYGIAGGVRDALTDSGGSTYAVDRGDAVAAKARFERLEGLSIDEPSACACAALEQAAFRGTISPQDTVLLNVTGGGERDIRRHHQIYELTCVVRVPAHDVERSIERVAAAASTHFASPLR